MFFLLYFLENNRGRKSAYLKKHAKKHHGKMENGDHGRIHFLNHDAVRRKINLRNGRVARRCGLLQLNR